MVTICDCEDVAYVVELLSNNVTVLLKVVSTPPPGFCAWIVIVTGASTVPEYGVPAITIFVALNMTTKFVDVAVPPPGAGLVTVIVEVPSVAMSDARMGIVSWFALTSVTVFCDPLNITVVDAIKFDPLMVNVKFDPSALADVGENVVIVGVGFVIDAVVVGCASR